MDIPKRFTFFAVVVQALTESAFALINNTNSRTIDELCGVNPPYCAEQNKLAESTTPLVGPVGAFLASAVLGTAVIGGTVWAGYACIKYICGDNGYTHPVLTGENTEATL